MRGLITAMPQAVVSAVMHGIGVTVLCNKHAYHGNEWQDYRDEVKLEMTTVRHSRNIVSA